LFEVTITPVAGTVRISDEQRLTDAVSRSNDRLIHKAFLDAKKSGKVLYIDKKYVDARHGHTKLIYRFDFITQEEMKSRTDSLQELAMPYKDEIMDHDSLSPVIVGFGPAGIFAALILARYGLKPVVIERGSSMQQRVAKVESFRKGNGSIDNECNVQFGEGGAGTFSDGKLFTGLTSGLKGFVADCFVRHGADKSILYEAHPHIGTDILRSVIVGIREEIESLGGQILFDTKMTELVLNNNRISGVKVTDKSGTRIISCSRVILAVGHSSRDTFRYLHSTGIAMESKPFAVGVRIEHKRRDIDIAQYGMDTSKTGDLSAANYKLAVDTVTGRKLYTFCMCPGGEVINASSGKDQSVVNGMSYYGRDLENSNSALLVPVDSGDYGTGVLAGVEYQERLEKKAYEAAGATGAVPVMRYYDLVNKTNSPFGSVQPSVKPRYVQTDFSKIFDPVILETITDGIAKMGKKIRGFDSPDACLSAVESRSSSPVRILRDRDARESISVEGLYPAGEGAGYAGGIMSSAIDGINCANSLAKCYIISK